MDDYSGWQPGQPGKGFIPPEGSVQHWVTDTAGNPHHMMMAGEDENPDFYKRFDIMPDGRVIDIVDHLSQRFDHDDWKKVLNSHPDFYAAEEAAEQGFGHADSILDSLHRREAMEDIERSMRWAVERYGSSSTRKLIEQAESLPPDRTETFHDYADGWKIVKPTTFGDIHRTGELMGNCWSWNENEQMWEQLCEQSPEMLRKSQEIDALTQRLRQTENDSPEYRQLRQQIADADKALDAEAKRNMHLPVSDPAERMLHDPYGIPRVAWYEGFGPDEMLGRHNSIPKKEYWDRLEQVYPGVTPREGVCTTCGIERTPQRDAKWRQWAQTVYDPEKLESILADPTFCTECGDHEKIYTGR